MATNDNAVSVREAVGIFANAEALKGAIDELLTSDFHDEELGLLASADAVEDALGDLYSRTNEDAGSPDAPAIAFVGRESIGEAASTLGGSLFFIGTSGIAGAVVASAAIFGGAVVTALGGLIGVGVVGALVAKVIHQSDAEYLQQQVDEGRILLFVRLRDPSREEQAITILKRHCGLDVKVYDAPAKYSKENSADSAVT